VFLAQQLIAGETLDRWAAGRQANGGVDRGEAVALIGRLLALVKEVHEAGFVIGDLKPSNVMVQPSGGVRLIDVETVVEQGQHRTKQLTTPAFAAPEILAAGGQNSSPAPTKPTADCYSLGLTLFVLLTGLPPMWVRGRPGRTCSPSEVRQQLRQIARSHPILALLTELLVGLTLSDPRERWSLKQAQDFLLPLTGRASTGHPSRPAGNVLSNHVLDRLLQDGLTDLHRAMTPHEPALWTSPPPVSEADPCNAWFGAAGPLATLSRAAAVVDDQELRDDVAAAVATGAAWIDERRFAIPRLLPGLAFGRSGTAWALFDAARFLGDEKLASHALELARRLPTEFPNPDITHGLSGAGMAHLHLWQVSGHEDLLRRAQQYAHTVLAAARRSGDDWWWPIGSDTDGTERTVYGFAHGVAGAGAFLLATAQALTSQQHDSLAGRRFLQAAIGAGDTLARAAHYDKGAAYWPKAVGEEEPHKGHWCGGAAGIGSFLIRLWAATGEARFADLAEQAALTATHNPWGTTFGACCGLPGDGHFLLDMAELTGLGHYRSQAGELANVIYAQRTVRDGLQLVREPDDGHSYASGTCGALDFLFRLRHGGPPPWHPDPSGTVIEIHHAAQAP